MLISAISFFCEVSVLLYIFKNGVCFLIELYIILYILNISSLSDMGIMNILSMACICPVWAIPLIKETVFIPLYIFPSFVIN